MKKTLLFVTFALFFILSVVALFFTIRQVQASRDIEAELAAELPAAPLLVPTSGLEILPLYEEASSGSDLISGHGVSYLIRTDQATILLDVGNNPDQFEVAPFAQNMQSLGLAWDEIDRIVISHPHPDHLGGLQAWQDNTIAFGELPGGMDDRLVFVPSKVAYQNAIHATIPTLPSPDIATTGVISFPEVFPLSLFEPKGHEQALVVHVENEGLVMITGCGHPTLETLVERAESLYSLPVVGIVGGLHYEGLTAEEIQPHIQFLQTREIKLVALSPHDSSQDALAAFRRAFPSAYQDLMVGSSVRFPTP